MNWFFFCLTGTALAYSPAALIEETHFTETSFKMFQQKLDQLNLIQGALLNNSANPIRPPGQRPSPPRPSVTLNETVPSKPDQLPNLYQGDIVLTDKQMDEILEDAKDQLLLSQGIPLRKKRSMTSDLSVRWTFPIPYYINTATGVSTSAVLAGINKWQEETCVTFSRLNSLPSRTQGLNFILGQGCYSYIGRSFSGPQTVSIGNGCTSLGTVTHEIGHALGFYHEQARWDRDSYVQILTQNIQSTYLDQFTKQSAQSMVDYGVGYDLGSVMHYDQTSFTANNLPTIKTLDPNYQITIGQRMAPSFADVKRINFAYCNSTCTSRLACLNGGYTDPKACRQCRCPDGFGGTLCDRADTGDSGCPAGDLTATSTLQTVSSRGALNCPFVITAPAGRQVFFQIGTFSFTNWPPCSLNYLEVKYGSDFARTGARFCANYPSTSMSTTNRLVVIYKGSSNSAFSLSYRYDPPTPIITTSTTTTTATSPATTTIPSTTTTSTRPTRTTTLPPWTTTTTQRTTTTTTTAPTTTSTSAPTGCSAWSQCTADCGGCGLQSRNCNGRIQSQHCNTNLCSNGRCCLPYFRFNGQCVKPF